MEDRRFKIWRYFLVFWMIGVLPVSLFSQQKKAIRPLATQNSVSGILPKEPALNPEYEKALQEYEALIKKYPDKKELFYNLGNLNYLSGDSESALQNYKNSLIDSQPDIKADALYNMGNTFYQMGDLQNSVDFFKEALKLDPADEDIRYNYELSKRMLEQQPPQEKQDKNQDDKEGDQKEEQNQDSQQSQEGDEQEQDSKGSEKGENEGEKDQQQSEDGEEKLEEGPEQSQSQEGEEKNEEAQKQKTESQVQAEKEKQLGKEEAEAILNAMKADENNLKPRKYKAKGLIKLEKDW
jgi:tetratricopeptide (TPR) repeat protein